MRVSTEQDSTERFAESSEQRVLFRGGAVLLQGPFLSLLLWDSRRGGMHQGLTVWWVGRAASIVSSLCPFPKNTVWLCL